MCNMSRNSASEKTMLAQVAKSSKNRASTLCRREGIALTGYDIPGCVEHGAWMLWYFFSAAAAVVTKQVHKLHSLGLDCSIGGLGPHCGLKCLWGVGVGVGWGGVRLWLGWDGLGWLKLGWHFRAHLKAIYKLPQRILESILFVTFWP